MATKAAMQKPWHQSLTIMGGILLGVGIGVKSMLSPSTQAIVTTAATFAPDTIKHVANTVSTGINDALPGVLQGLGVILSGFGLRRAIAANGNNK